MTLQAANDKLLGQRAHGVRTRGHLIIGRQPGGTIDHVSGSFAVLESLNTSN